MARSAGGLIGVVALITVLLIGAHYSDSQRALAPIPPPVTNPVTAWQPPEACRTVAEQAEAARALYVETGSRPAWWTQAVAACDEAIRSGGDRQHGQPTQR